MWYFPFIFFFFFFFFLLSAINQNLKFGLGIGISVDLPWREHPGTPLFLSLRFSAKPTTWSMTHQPIRSCPGAKTTTPLLSGTFPNSPQTSCPNISSTTTSPASSGSWILMWASHSFFSNYLFLALLLIFSFLLFFCFGFRGIVVCCCCCGVDGLKGFVVFYWFFFYICGLWDFFFYFVPCSTFYLWILWHRLIDWYESRICRSVLHLHWVCSTFVNLA